MVMDLVNMQPVRNGMHRMSRRHMYSITIMHIGTRVINFIIVNVINVINFKNVRIVTNVMSYDYCE